MLRRLTRCSSLCGESKLKAFCFQWRVPAAPREAGPLRGGADAPSSALLPMRGRSAPPPRVTFSPMRKSPKNLPEGATPSGYSPWGALSSPQRRQAPLPPERGETPGSPQKPNLTAAPRIDSRGCDPRCSLGRKIKTDLPTNSKWQIGLVLW